jgi:hypothetical protein
MGKRWDESRTRPTDIDQPTLLERTTRSRRIDAEIVPLPD